MPKITFKNNTTNVTYTFDRNAKPISEDAIGRVYRGTSKNANGDVREVAIKCINEGMPSTIIDRARNEASIRFRNDNLVEMLDFVAIDGHDIQGQPITHYHVISELLIGVSLADVLQGKTEDQYGFTTQAAVELMNLSNISPYIFALKIVSNILRGLMVMHQSGYIHRNLDLTKILITKDDKIKIIDFSHTKKVGSVLNPSMYGIVDSPIYAAPELLSGDIYNQSFTTDLYQVGGILFHLLTGEPPFKGLNHQVMVSHLCKDFPLKKVTQRKIAKVIKKAVDKDQQRRYQTCIEFLSDLDKLRNTPYERSFLESILSVILWP